MEHRNSPTEDTRDGFSSPDGRIAEEMAIMAEIGRVISSNLQINEVYDSFAAEVCKLIPCDRISVDLNNQAEGTFTVTYVHGHDIPGRRPGDSAPLEGSITEAILRTRMGMRLNVSSVEEVCKVYPGVKKVTTIRAGMRSLMSVPLISQDEVIGTLHFRSKDPNAYTEQDSRLAEKIGQQIAGAIANAQLYANLVKAEAALREKEERFRLAMDATNDGLWDWDIRTDNAYFSPSYYRMLGYKPTEFPITGQRWADSIHPDDKARTLSINQDCIENRQQSFETEYRMKTKDGTWKWILGRGKASSRDAQGRALRLIGTHVDITERRQAEEDLRKSREIAERLSMEAAIIMEIGRKITSTLNINEVYEMLAVESRKLISYDRLVVTRFNLREGVFRIVYVYGLTLPLSNEGEPIPIAGSIGEVALERRTGSIVQAANEEEINRICTFKDVISTKQIGILSLLSVPLISNDEVIGTINFRSKKPNAYTEADLRLAEGLGREIAGAITNAQLYSDLKKTEKSLQDGKELYSHLISAVPDAVVQIDAEGRITFANEITIRGIGHTDMSEIIGKNILDYVAPEDRERAADAARMIFEKRLGPQSYELIIENGRRVSVEINADVLRKEDGLALGAVLICRDVTERKRLENELHQLLESLEKRVQERTIELEEVNTALRVLLKKGEQDLRKKDHDFMENINQLIIPFLQKLQSSNSVEQQRSYARIIESNLANITSSFLNRLSDSYRNLTPTEIQIATLIRNGMSSKGIAETLNVSIGTVATHRNNIRKKLNLKSREANLRSHLLSLV